MTIQQLEYLVAVDTHRHFVTAAEKCFVTQATLSMMIKKLEEEWGVKIFDRSKKPVMPTSIGQKLIAQAKVVLEESRRLQAIVQEEQGGLRGDLKIGIIPTLAPYLLPLFLNAFLKKYPDVRVKISELTTEEIVRRLKQHELDVGLLATPLHVKGLHEQPLFYEDFVVYDFSETFLSEKKLLLAGDIDVNRLWLLEEGHCLTSQVINLCELKQKERESHHLDFAAGSLETLKNIVQSHKGITILPVLALQSIPQEHLAHIKYFKEPVPAREIGLVTFRHVVKEKLTAALKAEILAHVPESMQQTERKAVVDL